MKRFLRPEKEREGYSCRVSDVACDRFETVCMLIPFIGDIVSLHERLSTKVSCRARAGHHVNLKSPHWGCPAVEIVSVGLAVRWLHGDDKAVWTAWWNSFDAIICDEAHELLTDFSYGQLVTTFIDMSLRASFVFLSGTLPPNLGADIFERQDRMHIRCHQRQFTLDSYFVIVQDKEQEAVQLARYFFGRGESVLVFLTGKAEIASAKDQLIAAGVPLLAIETLHREMMSREINARIRAAPTIYRPF